jgi:hypothetical protein
MRLVLGNNKTMFAFGNLHRSKDRQDGPIRKNFNKMEAYTSTSNACMMSSGPEFGSGQLYNSLGYSRNFLQREPLMTTSRPQTFENSLSFPNRVSCAVFL